MSLKYQPSLEEKHHDEVNDIRAAHLICLNHLGSSGDATSSSCHIPHIDTIVILSSHSHHFPIAFLQSNVLKSQNGPPRLLCSPNHTSNSSDSDGLSGVRKLIREIHRVAWMSLVWLAYICSLVLFSTSASPDRVESHVNITGDLTEGLVSCYQVVCQALRPCERLLYLPFASWRCRRNSLSQNLDSISEPRPPSVIALPSGFYRTTFSLNQATWIILT